MIHHLYIIDSGVSIYSYHFKKGSEVDEQLLSGFLTAMGSFAKQTFKGGLQTIYIEREKLNFYLHQDTQLLFCAISDTRDNDNLLESLLKEIANRFADEMSYHLNSNERAQTANYQEFDSTLKELTENIAKDRSKKTMFLGLLLGLIFLIGSFIITLLFTFPILESGDETSWGVVMFLYIFVGLSVSSFISGYFAGTQRMGFINGVIFFILFAVTMIILIQGSIGIVALILPFAIIMCGAAGNYGGLIRERKKLYPIQNDTRIVNDEK